MVVSSVTVMVFSSPLSVSVPSSELYVPTSIVMESSLTLLTSPYKVSLSSASVETSVSVAVLFPHPLKVEKLSTSPNIIIYEVSMFFNYKFPILKFYDYSLVLYCIHSGMNLHIRVLISVGKYQNAGFLISLGFDFFRVKF